MRIKTSCFPTYCADIATIVNAKKNEKIKKIFILNVMYPCSLILLIKGKLSQSKKKWNGLQWVSDEKLLQYWSKNFWILQMFVISDVAFTHGEAGAQSIWRWDLLCKFLYRGLHKVIQPSNSERIPSIFNNKKHSVFNYYTLLY